MNLEVSRKDDSSIVTEADFWVQNYLVDNIAKKYPDFNFVYEENGTSEMQGKEDSINVIIDPIDGTAMYSMGLPIWCISVGIFNGFEPAYGFVYSPASNLFFYNDDTASYLNDTPVHVNNAIEIDHETNIFYSTELKGKIDINFEGKARNLGSTALHASLIADNCRNRVLSFIGKSYIWDWAGAIPVIEKAGGMVRYIDGSKIDYGELMKADFSMKNFVVATAKENFDSMKEIFTPSKQK